eukprot:scaffold4066_cov107-Isochrysis_galbana.AAC.1
MVCVTQVYPHTGVSTHRCVLRFNSRGSIQVYPSPSIHATPGLRLKLIVFGAESTSIRGREGTSSQGL